MSDPLLFQHTNDINDHDYALFEAWIESYIGEIHG